MEVPLERSSPANRLPWLPAQVPGHVHLDLTRAGVIQAVNDRLGERGAAWVDATDWMYETIFTVEGAPPENALLLFHGLDTVAEVALNGEPLGAADNMFIPHEFSVNGLLKTGENTLRVTFRSALRVGNERHAAWDASGNDTLPFDWQAWNSRSFLRKAQYMYGWDWGPEPVSCGFWQPVELVTVPVARLLDWRYEVIFEEDGAATVTLEAFAERAPGAPDSPLTLVVALPEVVARGEEPQPSGVEAVTATFPSGEGRVGATVTLRVENPRRWRPAGHGEPDEWSYPALYETEITLHCQGEELDAKAARIGLRTVELIQEPGVDGARSFQFRVNGVDTYMKGANWIPASSFPSTAPFVLDNGEVLIGDGWAEGDRVGPLLEAAEQAGMNMLRVWGGGLYESEYFYSLCDELGLLVWQDFPYACAYYPDTDEYAEAARREATAAVRRLRVHPSLAIWCGNNENHQLYHDGWGGNRPPRYLGEHLYHEVLPQVTQREDPNRPYWPSSPYLGDNPNDPTQGDRHDWDVWHGVGDWVHYRGDRSRFCSEFGFGSSCGMRAWNTCLDEADKEPHSAAVRWHDKTRKGYETYLGYIALHYPEPVTLEDLVYTSQINQAEAMKCAVENWRRQKGWNWGALIWQLNDCWPVQSWALIDYEGEPKAAYYWAKRGYFAPELLSLVQEGDKVVAHLTNDRLQPIQGVVNLTLETFEGERLAETSHPASIAANGTGVVAALDLDAAAGREREVIVCADFLPDAESAGAATSNLLFLAEPKDLALPDPGLQVTVEEQDEEAFLVRVTAKRFAPYVWLSLSDTAEESGIVEWTDNFLHLRAGETVELLMYTSGLLQSPAEARSRLRIRTL